MHGQHVAVNSSHWKSYNLNPRKVMMCFRFKNFGTRKMTNIGELTFIQGLGITILPPGFLRLINKKTSNGKTPDGFRSPSKSVHLDKHNLSIVHQVVSFTEKM